MMFFDDPAQPSVYPEGGRRPQRMAGECRRKDAASFAGVLFMVEIKPSRDIDFSL